MHYCHTCNKSYHYLGIARHRAAHRDRSEDCTITDSNGQTYTMMYDVQHEAMRLGYYGA